MTTFLAEDFRKLIDRLNEYITMVGEDDKDEQSPATDDQASDEKPSSDSPTDDATTSSDTDSNDTEKDVDDLLTEPSGQEKIVGSIDIHRLTDLLELPKDQQIIFGSAIHALKQDEPHLNTPQAMALATAFVNMLKLSSTEKTAAATMMRPVSGISNVTEETEQKDQDADSVSIDDLQKSIKSAAESSPSAKLHAIKLVKSLMDGMKDRHLDGGIDHVMAGVADALDSARSGDHAESLKRIASLVAHVEGDGHAINIDSFPNLVVDLILLTGEISQRGGR